MPALRTLFFFFWKKKKSYKRRKKHQRGLFTKPPPLDSPPRLGSLVRFDVSVTRMVW
jgi:hypothetical protein